MAASLAQREGVLGELQIVRKIRATVRRARLELREESDALRRLRELRARLGIDPPGARP